MRGTPNPGDLLNEAIVFAVRKHAGTVRKGTALPYIVHPLEVAAIVAGITDDEEVIAAAVLHDTLEDTQATKEEIIAAFGDRVAALVADESENKRENERPENTWKIRKQETLSHLTGASHDAKVIALGDKLSNIRAIQRDYEAIGEKLWDRFNQKDPALHGWYYRSIAEILSADETIRGTSAMREYKERVSAVFGHC